ncbi:MAG: hypothetical protein KDK25_00055 [Leptospiraceae bacterium]|nr:hypothetical protein [Leptospiraceae bacterium]
MERNRTSQWAALRGRKSISATLTFLILLLAQCSSGTVMKPAYGANYFDDQFECTTGKVEQESNKDYHLKRLAWIAALPEPPAGSNIILTGESTAALFTPDLLKKYLPEYNITNRAIPGETTVVFMASLNELVIKHRPRLIILAIGGNDLLGGRCISTILRNTEIILDEIHRKLPGTRVLLVSIPPVVSWKVSSIAGHLNLGFQQLVNRKPFVEYVDLWPYLADEKRPALAPRYQLYYEQKDKVDQVHFNAEGYARFAEALRKHLRN